MEPFLVKKGIPYFKMTDGTIYSSPLPQFNKIGGQDEIRRNKDHNPERMIRIISFFNFQKKNYKVADYGAGNGLFVNFLLEKGIDAVGYDKYNPCMNQPLLKENFDVVTAIEVLEHTSEPYSEVDEIFDCLKPGGILMVEMSFIDWMDENDPYIDPDLGHSTIFSHKGLDLLMLIKGFQVYTPINRNVRIFKKPIQK